MAKEQETDHNTLKSARLLIESLWGAVPRGETRETIGDFIQVHRIALGKMKQRPGKAGCVMELADLAVRYPYVPTIGDTEKPLEPIEDDQGALL